MRADKFFAERFGSRSKAAAALKEGLVLHGGKPVPPDGEIREGDIFTFLARKEEFVSGGGYKLARGLDEFGRSVAGLVFTDLGASTGGFTDCLLQRGAKKVYCVDVGCSQLAPTLARDPRVCVMDHVNARYLKPSDFPVQPDGAVCDLSFISLRLILPAVQAILPEQGSAYVLFKPQFECGREGISKNGICPRGLHKRLLAAFYDFCLSLPLAPVALTNAPVRPQKNVEYIVWLQKGGVPAGKEDFLSPLSLIK